MDPNTFLPASEEAKFLNVPYEERWGRLKPVIVKLYMGRYGDDEKKMTIQQVADFMKNNYSFFGAVTQYRRWFREWGVRKRTEAGEKDDITTALGKRSHSAMSTSEVTLHTGSLEKSVDKRQLTRHIKAQMGRFQPEPLSPGVLSSWNLPYAAYVKCLSRSPDQPSPFGETSTTPAYLSVHSPAAVTPGRQVAPSPTMRLVQQKAVQYRSNLLLQGRFAELLVSCGREDRGAVANYLHDFYLHSFVSAKYWGRGPRGWTMGMVSALTLGSMEAAGAASSPAALGPPTESTELEQPFAPGFRANSFSAPTQLCQWSIHVPDVRYEQFSEHQDAPGSAAEFDIERPSSWPLWTAGDLDSTSLPNTMRESISSSTFTGAAVEELPVSVGLISDSVQNDPAALWVDSVRLAIISGNLDLLKQLMGQREEDELEDAWKIYPLHLAASYLDGGNTCCLVFQGLLRFCQVIWAWRYNINDTGHTVLDSLLMSVLRSHTSVSPDHVSVGSNPLGRYPGEEKDICGRWDADSPAVRELFGNGYARIPTSWKHPFCHSAVQAVCHSAIDFFRSPMAPEINISSGLFVRLCTSCGLELRPGPIHTLVIVAFYLAQTGMAGETLFGAMSALVCLIRLRASISSPADISVGEVFGTAESEGCSHTPMTPGDLMMAVPGEIIDRWTEDCRVGWDCIVHILRLGQSDEDMDEGSEVWSESGPENPKANVCDDAGKGPHGEWLLLPCGSPTLGILWATIQVELLTYRRVDEGAPWISENFSMRALRAWLAGETGEFRTPLVENRMMKSHFRCGWFCNSGDFTCPVAEEVCAEHFVNMDVYSRTSLIRRPDYAPVWVDITDESDGD